MKARDERVALMNEVDGPFTPKGDTETDFHCTDFGRHPYAQVHGMGAELRSSCVEDP